MIKFPAFNNCIFLSAWKSTKTYHHVSDFEGRRFQRKQASFLVSSACYQCGWKAISSLDSFQQKDNRRLCDWCI